MPPTKTQRWLDLLSFLLGRRVPVPVEEIMERVPAYAQRWVEGTETDRATARRTFERDKDDLRRLGVPLEPVPYSVGGGMEQFEGYRIADRDFYLPYLKLIGEKAAPASPPPGPGSGAGGRGAPPAVAGGAGAGASGAPASSGTGSGSAPDRPPSRPYPGLADLELSPTEAETALEALRRAGDIPAFPFAAEAASALRKLSFDLDVHGLPGDPVMWVERPGSGEVLARLRALTDALLARKRIRFDYAGIYRGSATHRHVAPYGLFFQRDWYLVAHDEDAAAIRIFRVSRMNAIEPNVKAPKSPDFELPADFSLQDLLDRRAWELGEEEAAVTADVRFRYPLSLSAQRNGEGEWVRHEPDGGAVRRFTVSRPDPFLRWILSLAGDAEILSPPDLQEELRAMARAVVALYADD